MTRFRSSSPDSPEARHDGGVARATRPDSFLVTFTDSLRTLTDALEIQAVAVGLLGTHLGVDRAFYATIESVDGEEHFVVQRAFHAPGAVRISGRYPLREFSRTLHDEARNGQTMVASDISRDPRFPADVLEQYQQLGVRSYVGVPLVKDGRWVASVGVHSETPRDWTTEEIRLVEEVAERTWAAVERAKAEEASRVAEERYLALFNAIDQGFCTIQVAFDEDDRAVDYRFLEVSPSFEQQTGIADAAGRWMREIADDHDESWFEVYGRVALTGEPARFEGYSTPIGRWWQVYAFRIGDPRLRQIALLFSDISERKRREANLAFLADVSEQLIKTSDIWQKLPAIAGKIAEYMKAERCVFSQIDAEKGVATVTAEWHAPGARPLMGSYRIGDFFTEGHLSEWLAGETFAVDDVTCDPRIRYEHYLPLGVRSFLDLPIVRDGKILFTLTVTSSAERKWLDAEVELMCELAERIWSRLERALSERALKESEAQLRAIYNGTREYIGLASADGTVLRANRVALDFAGARPEDVIGKPLWETVWFGYTNGAPELVRKGFEIALQGEFFRTEMALRRPNGEQRIFDFSLHPIKDETGNVVLVVPEGHDITDIRVAESALRLSEERYRGIVNQAVAGIAEIDLEGNFLTMNDRFCELTGYTRDRLFDLSVLEITHPDDRQASREKLGRLIKENMPFEIEKRYVRPDGSSVWVLNSVYSIRGANGRPQSMAAFVIDISERKRAESRLKRSETMMSTLVESAPFGIYFIDSDFRLMSVNRGAAAVFEGISPLIGRNFEEILHEVWDEPFATEAAGHFRRTLETGEPFHSQAADEVRAGGLKTESYDWQIHRIALPDGKHGVVCYFYDLTKQKQLEATVRHAARLDAFRVRLTEALLAATDPLETQAAASCLLGEELGASRAMYFEVRQGAYVVETDYCNDVQSVVGWHSAESFGPTLLEVFQRGEVAISCDTANDSRLSEGERSAFESIGIGAYIAVPILKEGILAAGMSVHAATPRDWSPESIALARETAERTWAAVERIRAEELARTIDQRLRVATDAAELGTWEWHFETGRLFWNERHFTMMGLEPVEGAIAPSVFFERVHRDDVEYLNRELRRSIDFGAVFDAVFRVVLNDGSIRWMSGYGKRTDSGIRTPAVMSGVVVDITDRMNIEEELRESNERLRLLIESATDCSIFTTDRNGVINTWNSGSSRIYGYEENEILGRNVEILFTPEDRRKRMHEHEMETAIEMGRALDERWHMRKDGTRFYASGVTQPLGAGGAEGFVKIARDMTERLRAEQSAREREMLRKLVGAQEEERKRIARDLHDELGQQLTALRLKLDRVGDAAPEPLELTIKEVKEIARSIDEGVDFLAWELRPAALDDLGLIPALESYIKEWSSYSGVEARLNAAMQRERRFEPAVETAMYRIVQESLNNVHKHAGAKLAEITLTLHEGHLVLVIEDNGGGFEPEDPEIRRKGIGLIGIHERVQILGGTVEIESRPGNGTTIYVRAPIAR